MSIPVASASAGICATLGIGMISATIYFFRYQQFPFFKKRGHLLLIASATLSIIETTVVEPLAILHVSGVIDVKNFQIIVTSLYILFMHAFLLIIALRFWMTLYSYKHSEALKDQKWRQAINPDEKNFFITSRSTYGKTGWVGTRIVIAEILLACIMITLDFLKKPHIRWIVNACVLIIIAIFTFVIYIQLHKVNFEDWFFLRNEAKAVTIVLGIHTVIFLIISGLYEFLRNVSLGIAARVISAEMSCALWLVLSLYVIRLYSTSKREAKTQLKRHVSKSSRSSEYTETVYQRQAELILYLEAQKGFDAFMDHLVSEFSLESLLFIVELMQYKDLFPQTTKEEDEELRARMDEINTSIVRDRLSYIGLMNNGSNHSRSGRRDEPRPSASMSMNAHQKPVLPEDLKNMQKAVTLGIVPSNGRDGKERELRVTLPKKLPVSPLSHMDDVFERGKYLYAKYIQPNSELELNIPWEMRKTLGNFFGDKNVIEAASPRGAPVGLGEKIRRGSLFGRNDESKSPEEQLKPEEEAMDDRIGDLAYLRLVFDEAGREVVDLMLDAFERYQGSDNYVPSSSSVSTVELKLLDRTTE